MRQISLQYFNLFGVSGFWRRKSSGVISGVPEINGSLGLFELFCLSCETKFEELSQFMSRRQKCIWIYGQLGCITPLCWRCEATGAIFYRLSIPRYELLDKCRSCHGPSPLQRQWSIFTSRELPTRKKGWGLVGAHSPSLPLSPWLCFLFLSESFSG